MTGPEPLVADEYVVGEVRALRTFRLGPDGRLFPLYDDRPWLPGKTRATCRRGHDHPAPARDCRCGYYAHGDLAWVGAQPPSRSVLAAVALWGQIEVASRGVRAASGRVEAPGCTPASTPGSSSDRRRLPRGESLPVPRAAA